MPRTLEPATVLGSRADDGQRSTRVDRIVYRIDHDDDTTHEASQAPIARSAVIFQMNMGNDRIYLDVKTG